MTNKEQLEQMGYVVTVRSGRESVSELRWGQRRSGWWVMVYDPARNSQEWFTQNVEETLLPVLTEALDREVAK